MITRKQLLSFWPDVLEIAALVLPFVSRISPLKVLVASRVGHLVVAAVLGIIAQGVWAQGDAWYAAGGLGASFPNDVDVRGTGVGRGAGTVQLESGILVTGAFGRSFGNVRVEGELAYNTNDISTLSVPRVGVLSASGDVSTLVLMLNGYYDFSTNSKWEPYVGGGIGGGNVSINSLSVQGMPAVDNDEVVIASLKLARFRVQT